MRSIFAHAGSHIVYFAMSYMRGIIYDLGTRSFIVVEHKENINERLGVSTEIGCSCSSVNSMKWRNASFTE